MLPIKFIVDENLVRLGRAMSLLRQRENDVHVFGSSEVADIAPKGVLDPNWIPSVAKRGYVIITDDRGLRVRPAEASLCIEYGAKIVHIYKAGHLVPWEQLLQLTARWAAIEKYIADNVNGPWWLSVRKNQLRPMRYEPGAVER